MEKAPARTRQGPCSSRSSGCWRSWCPARGRTACRLELSESPSTSGAPLTPGLAQRDWDGLLPLGAQRLRLLQLLAQRLEVIAALHQRLAAHEPEGLLPPHL